MPLLSLKNIQTSCILLCIKRRCTFVPKAFCIIQVFGIIQAFLFLLEEHVVFHSLLPSPHHPDAFSETLAIEAIPCWPSMLG